ncbi:hypothetical protein Tco_0455965 [Tanacetum coccineum]
MSTSSLWAISLLSKSHLRCSVFSRLTLRLLSSKTSLQFLSLMFKPSTDCETSTISSAKTKHHWMSSWIPLDSSSRIKVNRVFQINSRGRSPGQKTELFLRYRSLSLQPSLDHSLPKLHGVTEKLDTLIVSANLRIAFVFEDSDVFTKSSLFRHLRASEDLVEKAS